MTELYYVATDRNGVVRRPGSEVTWNLPIWDGTAWRSAEATRSTSPPLIIHTIGSLLDALDESIFVATPERAATTTSDEDGTVSTTAAVLERGTNWNLTTAAQFALDCAEHVAGDLVNAELPDGTTIQSVIADARQVLSQTATDEEHRLGRLARLAAARRIQKRGDQISDIALELLSDDVGHDLDALDDPNYATTASIVDAVLAAVETIRHLALPRYFEAREDVTDNHPDSEPSRIPTVISTPWGPIAFGAEHHPPYVSSWVAARDAATRAREAVEVRTGSTAVDAERSWQAKQLGEVLHSR